MREKGNCRDQMYRKGNTMECICQLSEREREVGRDRAETK